MTGLDLCFLPMNNHGKELPTDLIVKFSKRYYAVLSNKPIAWNEMIANLERKDTVALMPI